MKSILFALAVAAAVTLSGAERDSLAAEEGTISRRDAPTAEECEAGVMITQIKQALLAPENDASLQTIVQYGTDTRYYLLVRGWLKEELAAVQSQLEAAKEEKARLAFEKKAEFLKKAIRRIDLE